MSTSIFLFQLNTDHIFLSSSLAYLLLDEGQHFLALDSWAKELDDLALAVNKEFRKVPRNLLRHLSGWVIETTVVSKIGVNWMRLLSIDLDLLHDGKFGIEVVLHKGLDLLMTATFLSSELIAWKHDYFKALAFVLFICFGHVLIVLRGVSAMAGNIHDHG